MVAGQVHLVRHGEVFNPDGVLYGRLPGFGLSTLGHEMAACAATYLVKLDRPVRALAHSPLQRTRESAAPIIGAFGLMPTVEPRIIEPTNHFEGLVLKRAAKNPRHWPWLVNPVRPSWGEPYSQIAARMLAALSDAFDSVDEGDVALVSHQLPIWITHLSVAGEKLWHDPRSRRCALSSVTSFALADRDAPAHSRRFVEVAYAEPAAGAQAEATDVGAV